MALSTCNGKPTAQVAESTSGVVLTVTSTVLRDGNGADCADGLVVTLAEPLGGRRLLDQPGISLGL
jgi:hypothetical protein